MALKCLMENCLEPTVVKDSREVEGHVWRRRECAAGHRFSTREMLYLLTDEQRKAIFSKNGKKAADWNNNRRQEARAETTETQLPVPGFTTGPLKILAFLQNPWFKPGVQQRHIEMYMTDVDFHRRVLAMSATGRALIGAFGVELYDVIVWDNASTVHGDKRDFVSPPDPAHMLRSLAKVRPNVVLLFGKQAQTGWLQVNEHDRRRIIALSAPHPMARGSQVDHLRIISDRVKQLAGRAS